MRGLWLVKSLSGAQIITSTEMKAIHWCTDRIVKGGDEVRLRYDGHGTFYVGIRNGNDIYFIQPVTVDEEII